MTLFPDIPVDECRILDLSAGNGAVWFGERPPGVVAVDRRHCTETVRADSRFLPFRDDAFDLVVFDPPHTNFGANGKMTAAYGHSTMPEIRDLIAATAAEAARCTRAQGLMALKWSDRDTGLPAVLGLMPMWRPLFGHHVAQRARRASSDRVSTTWWLFGSQRHGGCCSSTRDDDIIAIERGPA